MRASTIRIVSSAGALLALTLACSAADREEYRRQAAERAAEERRAREAREERAAQEQAAALEELARARELERQRERFRVNSDCGEYNVRSMHIISEQATPVAYSEILENGQNRHSGPTFWRGRVLTRTPHHIRENDDVFLVATRAASEDVLWVEVSRRCVGADVIPGSDAVFAGHWLGQRVEVVDGRRIVYPRERAQAVVAAAWWDEQHPAWLEWARANDAL